MKLTNQFLSVLLIMLAIAPAYGLPASVQRLIDEYKTQTDELLAEYKDVISDTKKAEIQQQINADIAKAKVSTVQAEAQPAEESADPTEEEDSQEIAPQANEEGSNPESQETPPQEENPEAGNAEDAEDAKNAENAKAAEEAKKKAIEQQEQKNAELQDNYDKAKENEQSLANRMTTAAGMGATGIGAMELMSGLAEKKADESAEQDMKAWLATMKCDYGRGLNITGGTTGIELPGGNELINLYTEFTTLASDLKVRKEALGLKPGLESEVILDKATTGLYDDVGIGLTNNAYASVAAALMDPDSEAAAAWNAQKEAAVKKIKAGAITAGVGAVGSLVANLAINSKAPKERSDEINKKYAPLLKDLKKAIEKLPDQNKTATCPSEAKGSYPSCNCGSNKVFSSNTHECITCTGDKVPTNNTCECPKGSAPSNNDTCVKIPAGKTPPCDTTKPHIKYDAGTNTCDCQHGYGYNKNTKECVCDSGNTDEEGNCLAQSEQNNQTLITTVLGEVKTGSVNDDGESTKTGIDLTKLSAAAQKYFTTVSDSTSLTHVILPGDKLFAPDKNHELTSDAKTAVTEFGEKIKDLIAEDGGKNFCIHIIGHTDRTGNEEKNKTASNRRASAVKDVLRDSGVNHGLMRTQSSGSDDCGSSGNQPSCRSIEINISANKCS